MKIHMLPAPSVVVKSNRQRRDLDQAKILDLAESIKISGVIHPIVIRQVKDDFILVAGERRKKAIMHLHFKRKPVRVGAELVPLDHIPCLLLGDIDPLDAEEIELEENIRREDLSWLERSSAIARLADLRARQAALVGRAPPTVADITRELKSDLAGEQHLGSAHGEVREDIILGNALKNPEQAKAISGATSKKEAVKLLKRHEETQRNAELGRSVGANFNSGMHTLLKGNCLDVMATLPEASFDVILTDPPYGIDAQDFGDSDGKTAGGHFYDDSRETFADKTEAWIKGITRLAKPQSHVYWFCDVEWFSHLKTIFTMEKWTVFRTPFIWVNPTAMRAPWPERGPQRKWQMILYAVRGDKNVTRLYSDVLTVPSDPNLGHQAQKPVALYLDLLRRSIRPGDSVLDPFAGTGPIFPACHELKCKATGIEQNDAAFGICSKRLGDLK